MSDEEVMEIIEEVNKSDWGVYDKYHIDKVRMAMSLANSRPHLKERIMSEANITMDAEGLGDYTGPLTNGFGENSASISQQGVPVWYGSAEEAYNGMGENSASISGQGVPQWYGSAEEGDSEHRVFYTVIDKNTGKEVDEGQMVISASSMQEAVNEAQTMLEEGGLEDEYYEVYPNGMKMNAEGDAATYSPSSNPDMVNEIQTEPTNANADLFGSETLAEIEGPTAEATDGELHSPSSFDISWEDGNGMSSASMPPNDIAWAENKETYCAGCKAAESGCHCAEGYSAESLADYEPIDSVEVDRTSYQPTQDYGSEFEGEFTDDMKKGAAYGIGAYAGWAFIGTAAILAIELLGRTMGE